jgi:hypothetical protein
MRLTPNYNLPVAEPNDERLDFPLEVDGPRTDLLDTKLKAKQDGPFSSATGSLGASPPNGGTFTPVNITGFLPAPYAPSADSPFVIGNNGLQTTKDCTIDGLTEVAFSTAADEFYVTYPLIPYALPAGRTLIVQVVALLLASGHRLQARTMGTNGDVLGRLSTVQATTGVAITNVTVRLSLSVIRYT